LLDPAEWRAPSSNLDCAAAKLGNECQLRLADGSARLA
jgi:hypothetical protein